MANIYTYSFEDTSLTIQHPSVGSYSAYGTGIGTLSISFTNDVSIHDVAADLAVVVSKSAKRNGTVSMEILQSSDFNTFLKKYINYVLAAPSAEFAEAVMVIKNTSTGITYTCTGVSPQKFPDESLQSQSQNKTYALMCANIDVS